MAKDKSLRSEPKLPKRKTLDPDDSKAPAEEIMHTKIQKKRRKMKVEVRRIVNLFFTSVVNDSAF